MAIVNVDDISLQADLQPKWDGLVLGTATVWCSVCSHRMNRATSRNVCGHDDSTIHVSSGIFCYHYYYYSSRQSSGTHSM